MAEIRIGNLGTSSVCGYTAGDVEFNLGNIWLNDRLKMKTKRAEKIFNNFHKESPQKTTHTYNNPNICSGFWLATMFKIGGQEKQITNCFKQNSHTVFT